MKWKYIIPFLLIAIGINTVSGQEFDISLSSPESSTQLHEARNSITLLAGYTYTPGGTGMDARIVNPVVTGSTPYTYTPVDPANRSLNTSYLVGATQGAFDVNPAGGASYTIPIDVLPGVNGLAPSLSLAYSSNSGPGVAGYGWQIGGISVVSRSGQNYYNDVAATGVDLASTDRFSLDGQRLVLAPSTGTYGANGTTYQTEIDGFTRVQSLTTNGYGPEKFLAQTKSGLKNLYGYDEDGKQRLDGINEILNWYVTETSDLYGNLISYSYLKDNSVVYPAEITYGPNKVTFYYKTRTDVTTTYLKGKKIIQQLLLDKVTVSYNSNVVKTYQLKYIQVSDNYNTYSALNEVIESGTGGSQLNSTAFSYQTPANVAIAQSTYNTSHSYISYQSQMYSGDFNGDGKADFLCLPSPNGSWTGYKVYYGDGNDNFSLAYENTSFSFGTVDDIRLLDVNGDGKDDILYETVSAGTSTFRYIVNNGAMFNSSLAFCSWANSVETGYSGKKRRKVDKQQDDNEISGADYNGDGINDVFINNASGNWKVYSMANSSGQLTSFMSEIASGTTASLANQTLSGDFNGDGKAEIWSFEDAGLKIYAFSGSTLTQIYTSTWPTKNHFFTLGDFNADGKVDIFLYGYKSGSTEYDWADWQVQLSTGTGFEQFNIPQKKANLKNDYVRLGDFNGDGCTDLMVTSLNQSWTGTYFYITKNKGTDFYTHTLPNYPIESHNYFVSDFNGDGRTDFICTDGLPAWWNGYQVYKSTGNTTPLLEKVANGLNHLTTIAYTKLAQAPTSVYQLGSTTPSFPVFNFQGAMPVVSSATMDNGIGGTNSLSYYYEGAKIHRQGKGFLCYSKMTATDATAGMLTETLSDFNTSYFYPQVTTVTKKLSPSGSTVETTSNTWAQTVLDATTKRIFPYVQSSTQTNALTGYSVTGSTSSVDSYGNPTQTVKTYSNGVSETKVANYTNTVNSTDWKLGRVDNSTITYAKSGETSVSHTVRYTYFTDGIMKPDLIYYYEGTPLAYSKNHDYDVKGNLTQVYTSGTSIGASQVNYTYDTDGIRVLTVTDPLGHVTTNTYDSYGRLYTEKDYLNNTNTYGYDALARQTSVSNTNGSQATTDYVWTGSNKPTLGVYGVIQTGNDGSVSTAWYDKLQRGIRTEKKGFGGTMIWIDTEYNAKGQTYRVSDPYFANGSLAWAETYTYDNYGRTTNVARNTSRNTTYSYSSATVSETTAGKTFSKTYGADGTLTSATDNGGTINYTYYPNGKTKNITAPGGVVTSMQYSDAARNQTQLADPSAGTINYTYDALGRVKTQTDARSMLTTYTYLGDGRTDNMVSPEGTTTYSYNTNKQLTGISSPNSVSRTYGYDTKGRVTSIAESIAGSNFSTSFTYDSYGRLSTRTHPSGIVETLGYNSYGYLSTISAGGSTRYTITSMNARQQLTGSTYGSNLTGTYGFDTYGYPSSSQAGTVQDYRYVFDATTGNLTSRQNFLRSKSESFTYDNLDRLLTATGPQNLTMTYVANGNLSTKSDIGTTSFGYGTSAGPYALTGVTSSTGLIPSTNQTATYTSFEKINTISEDVYSASFVYNSDRQRAKMDVAQSGSTILTRWYAGSCYMKETAGGVTKEYTYLGGDAYSAPVAAITQSGTTTYYYLLRDYLGNITHQVNTSNTVVAEYNFDAWGRRRSADDWSYTLDANDLALFADRGFTGHEYLKYFNLYNMNGRMYDPLVGRFLNPDPYVQLSDFTQNYNRYSYCLNNPLAYTDPSGELFGVDDVIIIIAVAIIVAKNYVDGVKANHNEKNPFKWDWSKAYFNFGVSSNSDGSDTSWALGVGWSPEALPAVGINNGKDAGVGYWSPDGPKLAYPGKKTTSPEQKVDKAVADARASVSDGSVDFGKYKISSDGLKGRLNDFANQTGYNIKVVGGDRNAARNTAVGGSKGSRHISGDAADIVVPGTSDSVVSIQAHKSGLFNTTIYYPNYNSPSALPPHVHVDLNPNHNNSLMIYKFQNGSNYYSPWYPKY